MIARLRLAVSRAAGALARARIGVVFVIVLAPVIGGIMFLGDRAGPLAPLRPMPAPIGTVQQIPLPGPGHRYLFFPISGKVEIGVKYRYRLLTHCGIDYPTGPDFDGSFWDSSDAVQRHQFTNPPPGFAGPEDDGYMVLRSTDRAEFHGSQGGVARYTRRAGTVVAGLCE